MNVLSIEGVTGQEKAIAGYQFLPFAVGMFRQQLLSAPASAPAA